MKTEYAKWAGKPASNKRRFNKTPKKINTAKEEAIMPQDKTEALLDDREKTHGDASKTFALGADLVTVVINFCGRPLKPHHFAVLNILHKIARIMCGSYHKDHWGDIEGYARLGKKLQKQLKRQERISASGN